MTERPALQLYTPPPADEPPLPPISERQRVRAIVDMLRVRLIGPDEAVERILAVFSDEPKETIQNR